MQNSKIQADNISTVELQKPIETTSAQLEKSPLLAAGFVVEYSFKGNERWLQLFNHEMPVVTNDFNKARRFQTKKAAEKALKKAIIANNNWIGFGNIIPVG